MQHIPNFGYNKHISNINKKCQNNCVTCSAARFLDRPAAREPATLPSTVLIPVSGRRKLAWKSPMLNVGMPCTGNGKESHLNDITFVT